MKVNILGTEYEIIIGNEEDYPRLRQVDGYTDTSIKKLVILDVGAIKYSDENIKDLTSYQQKVIRHEIIHAFFYESGLWINSNDVKQWAMNEEMVDWIARQGLKLYEAWKQAECV